MGPGFRRGDGNANAIYVDKATRMAYPDFETLLVPGKAVAAPAGNGMRHHVSKHASISYFVPPRRPRPQISTEHSFIGWTPFPAGAEGNRIRRVRRPATQEWWAPERAAGPHPSPSA